jgi:hypothetical protein
MLISTRAEFDKAEAIMRPYIDRGFDKLGMVVLGRCGSSVRAANHCFESTRR